MTDEIQAADAATETRNLRKERVGQVVSNKMQKTLVVRLCHASHIRSLEKSLSR
jgi:ribosomal protein S17